MPRKLIDVVLSLLLGALTLIGVFLYQQLAGMPTGGVAPVHIPGKSFFLKEGNGQLKNEQWLSIEQLSRNDRAIAKALFKPFPAKNYPVVSVLCEGLWAGTDLMLYWRKQEEPEKLYSYPLLWSGDVTSAPLGTIQQWSGNIVELGLVLGGELKGPVTLHGIELKPLSKESLIQTVWSQWTGFEGWHGYSINFIVGGVRNPLIEPVPAIAAWVSISLLSYGVMSIIRERWDWSVVILIVITGWLVLDLRWQVDFWRQWVETYHNYAGKSAKEKRAAETDGKLFALMESMKSHMPQRINRIFLLTKDPRATTKYLRLRAHYHLLPQNVYSIKALPPSPYYLRDGDFILVLGDIPGLEFDNMKGLLHWTGYSQEVSIVHREHRGTLYRVSARTMRVKKDS